MKKSVFRLCLAAAFLVSILIVMTAVVLELDRASGVDFDPQGTSLGAAYAVQWFYVGLVYLFGILYICLASVIGFFVSLFSAKKAFNRTIYILSVVLVGAHAVLMSVLTAFLIYMFC